MNHIEALLALSPLDIYDTNVPDRPTFPYLILSAPTFRAEALTLSREQLVFDDSFTVRAVGVDVAQARLAAAKARLAYDRAHPAVDGFWALVTLVSTSPFYVDPDVMLPGGEHPVIAADTYRYRATPASTTGS